MYLCIIVITVNNNISNSSSYSSILFVKLCNVVTLRRWNSEIFWNQIISWLLLNVKAVPQYSRSMRTSWLNMTWMVYRRNDWSTVLEPSIRVLNKKLLFSLLQAGSVDAKQRLHCARCRSVHAVSSPHRQLNRYLVHHARHFMCDL